MMAISHSCADIKFAKLGSQRGAVTSTARARPRTTPLVRLARTGVRVFAPQQPGSRTSVCTAAMGIATEVEAPSTGTEWFQKVVRLPAKSRGCHVVTRLILQELPELQGFEIGLANLFIQHTSASLTINENASPDVPLDLNDALDKIVPEGHHYRHDDEGSDDMPAHVKSSLMGPSLTIPIQHGRLALGTWQGVYLNEHRNYGGPRLVVVTLQGQKRRDGHKYEAGR